MKIRYFNTLKINLLVETGFSLVELLVTMSIISILALTAALKYPELSISFDKRNAEMLVIQDLTLSRYRSVEQGCQGIITIDADGGGYSYGCDYTPFGTTTPRVADSIIFSRDLPSTITISASSQIIFNSKGQTINSSGSISSVTLNLSILSDGSNTVFNTGNLLGTGYFYFTS